jgi:hypothetical protein
VRRIGVIAALAAVALAVAAPASAASNAEYGVQDDAWIMYGPGTLQSRIATLDRLGVRLVRITVRWDEVAPTRPAHPLDPDDPAYRWGAFDATIRALHAAGITTLVTLWGSPGWANGGHAPAWLPSAGLGDFAYAAAKEWPWVHLWTVWNEPNNGLFAHPVSPLLYTRHLLNPAYALLHRANGANRVAGGVTSPRKAPSGMSPYAFMLGMHAAHARLDAYAQNPYPGTPRETPFVDPCEWCTTFSLAHLPTIVADITRLFGPKQVWLTEYGYQTNPPDPYLGVSWAKQALYIGEAALRVWEQPRVTVLINFLVRDEPTLGGWQSGFFTAHGTAKPSYRAFGLPLAEVSRRGSRLVVWGQVRPGSGRRRYVLQRWTGHGWVAVGGSYLTGSSGTFERTLRAVPGEKLRIWTPVVAYQSPLLTVR